MPHLMIGYDLALFHTHDAILLFLSYQYLLYCLKQILLGHKFSSMLHGVDRSLVDHIGKICTNRPAGCQRNGIQIYAFI